MPMTFPSDPELNETYQVGAITWKWDGAKWVRLPGPSYTTDQKINKTESIALSVAFGG